jgi:hypothetical protein
MASVTAVIAAEYAKCPIKEKAMFERALAILLKARPWRRVVATVGLRIGGS